MVKLYQPIQLDDVDPGDLIIWDYEGPLGELCLVDWLAVVRFEGRHVVLEDYFGEQFSVPTIDVRGIVRRGFQCGVEWP